MKQEKSGWWFGALVVGVVATLAVTERRRALRERSRSVQRGGVLRPDRTGSAKG